MEQIALFHENSRCPKVVARKCINNNNNNNNSDKTTSCRKQDSDSSHHPPNMGFRFSAFLFHKLDQIVDEVRNVWI